MTMAEWHPDRKRRLRYEVLRILSVRHGRQVSRIDDTLLCITLRDLGWFELDMNDTVTILQDMEGRGWVRFRALKNIYARRTQLSQIEILPAGQDVFDQVTHDPAVEF